MRDMREYKPRKKLPVWKFDTVIGPKLTLYRLFRRIFGFQDYYAKMFCFKYLLSLYCPIGFLLDNIDLEYKIRRSISKFVQREEIGAPIRMAQKKSITHYIEIQVYKGIRHQTHRPTRGQRTRTNASKKHEHMKKDITFTLGLF
jgi:ribosomal protein S13